MKKRTKRDQNLLVPVEQVEQMIFLLRGQKVMVDADLAALYGVPTKVLNQAVTRNKRRFPSDFMFRLTKEERHELVTNCDRLQRLKHSSVFPRAFTEQGVAMLSTVLNSDRAIQVNIEIMRAFVRLRKMLVAHKDLERKLVSCPRNTFHNLGHVQGLLRATLSILGVRHLVNGALKITNCLRA